MIGRLAFAAHELDGWLHAHYGRIYVAILGWGLVISILGGLRALEHALADGGSGLGPLAVVVFQSALLINQLAQWHDLRERRRKLRGNN